jgi:hypothetical protein
MEGAEGAAPPALAAVAAAAAVPAVRFALSPATYSNEMLDYSKVNDIKLYAKAILALDESFDMRPKHLKLFLEELSIRAGAYGWNDVLDIPKDPDNPLADLDNLITSYGTITVVSVRKHATTYVTSNNRAAQDSSMMYLCIMASLTKEAKERIVLLKSQYTVDGVPAGAVLLRLVIQESSIDTNATTRFLRDQLSSLPVLMSATESNIVDFNEGVRGILDSLTARGETTQDLLSNLFKGYEAASDKKFIEYIAKLQDEYDDGKDITPDQLMLRATQKYRTLVQGGKWNAPDEQAQKIIALEATVKKLQKSSIKKTEQKDKKPGVKEDKKSSDGKTKTKSNKKPDWMLVKPKQGEPQKKTVNDKVYHWCPKHEAWTRHSPSECNGKGTIAPHTKDSDKRMVSFSAKPKMSISKALQAIAGDDGEESE